jgi:hypothetical protein
MATGTTAIQSEPAIVVQNPSLANAGGKANVTARRTLYFSEDNPESKFYVTVEGQTPKLFSADNPPAITTHRGSVEEWTIENRAQKNHEFHSIKSIFC